MAVRSRRLFGPTAVGTNSPDTVLLYTVPAGRTAILTVLCVNVSTLAAGAQLRLNNSLAPGQIFAVNIAAGASTVSPRIVLNPGDQLYGISASFVREITFTGMGSLLLGEPS